MQCVRPLRTRFWLPHVLRRVVVAAWTKFVSSQLTLNVRCRSVRVRGESERREGAQTFTVAASSLL